MIVPSQKYLLKTAYRLQWSYAIAIISRWMIVEKLFRRLFHYPFWLWTLFVFYYRNKCKLSRKHIVDHSNILPWCLNTTLDSPTDEYQACSSVDGITWWMSCKAFTTVVLLQLALWISKLMCVRSQHTFIGGAYILHICRWSHGSGVLQRIELATVVPIHFAFYISYEGRTPAGLTFFSSSIRTPCLLNFLQSLYYLRKHIGNSCTSISYEGFTPARLIFSERLAFWNPYVLQRALWQ